MARLQSATFKRGNTVLDLSGVACVDDGDGNDVSANTQSDYCGHPMKWTNQSSIRFRLRKCTRYRPMQVMIALMAISWGSLLRDQTVFSPGSNNPSDCLKPLLDLIGSPFELNDTFEFVWYAFR
ncbi:MAG: hypothetical protein R2787_04585 [Saprospiraceae bacterium]